MSSLGRCIALASDRRQGWVGTANGLLAFNENTGCEPFPGLAADVRVVTLGSNQGKVDNVGLWLLTRPYGIVCIADDGRVDLGWPQPPGIAAALALGNDGRPYAVTTRALWRLGPDEPVAVSGPAPDMITCLAQASDGLWWLGTAQGLFSLVNGGWQLAGEQPGPLQAEVFAFTVSDGCLWVATDTGLWARSGNVWQRHGASDPVFAVASAEGSGALWLADEHGIVRYDPASGASSARYTPFNSGLGSRRIVALAESAGALWIVTQAGISRLQLHRNQGAVNGRATG
jgi:ligand-binding sensor domain-containing protein